MKKKNILFVIFLCLCSALFFFAFSNSIASAKPKYRKTIRFWHHINNPSELKILNSHIKKFNDEFPDIKIRMLSFDFSVYRDSLKKNLGTKNAPDVFLIPNDWLGDLIATNSIQNLSLTGINAKNWIDSCRKQATFNNLVYGIPFYTETIALLYNKKLVKKPPAFLEAFLNELTALKSKCHPLSMDVNSAYYLLPWYFGMGGKLFKDNALHVEKNAFIQTCNFWLDLNYKKNLMFPIVEFEYKKSLNYFAAGNLAFLIDGPWAIPFLQSANVDFGIADLPYNSSAKRYVSPFIGTQLLCVSSKTEISEDIKKFLEIMTSLEIQIEFARESGKLPANNSAYNKLDKEKDWRIFAFYNQLKKGTPLPSSNEMNKLWSVLSQDNLINIFNKKETAENFANKNKEFFK